MLAPAFAAVLSIALAAQPPASAPSPAAASAPDQILGKWLGQAGFPQDRVEIALEFQRSPAGEITALLTQPVINLYGVAIPGAFTIDGSSFTNTQFSATLTLVNTAPAPSSAPTLQGVISAAKIPVTLNRAETLPTEAPVPHLPPGPDPRWVTKLGSPLYAPVTVLDDVAYVGSTGGVFHAINARDGSITWTFNAGRPIHGQALATPSGVYFCCDNGLVYRLDPATGKELWHYDLGDASQPRVLPHPAVYEYDYRSAMPVLGSGLVFIGGADGVFHAVDAESGSRRWIYTPAQPGINARIRASAVLAGDNVIVSSWDNSIRALNQASGSQVWVYDTKAPISSTPTWIDNKILVGNRGSAFRCLDAATGQSLWRQVFWGSWVESVAVPMDGRVYIGASDLRRVTCYDPGDGTVLWRTDVLGCPWGTPLVTETSVYVGCIGTDPYMMRHLPGVIALDRATGSIRWRWTRPAPSGVFQSGFASGPAAGPDDTFLISGLDGSLYCFPQR